MYRKTAIVRAVRSGKCEYLKLRRITQHDAAGQRQPPATSVTIEHGLGEEIRVIYPTDEKRVISEGNLSGAYVEHTYRIVLQTG
jgi:hypothetical protein